MDSTVLVVDDEYRMRKLVGDFLRKAGFSVMEAEDGAMALALLSSHISLVILDVMMPGMDGWETCRQIRQRSDTPVIMLTARSEESDELQGFEVGADEYIAKPFSPQVLVARVKALLRRTQAGLERRQCGSGAVYGRLYIAPEAHEVFWNGKLLDLTPKEYDLLCFLADNRGRALSRKQLLDQVWGYDYFGDGRTVDTHINRLRIKLGEASAFVQTVRGWGYLFEVAE